MSKTEDLSLRYLRQFKRPQFKIEPFPYAELLNAQKPLEIEIGCGKAKFIIQRAATHPEINFLAIDRVAKWMNVGKRRAEKRPLENLKFMRVDAWVMLDHYLPPESVDVFHIYFPDPWPKKKHLRRRLVTVHLLKALYERLKSGGRIYLASDFTDYFFSMQEVVRDSGLPWAVRQSRNQRLQDDVLMKTNYEIKYEAEGRQLNYMELTKICV
ncbi:MAG: tRNA (guanosine(46)-N7)-methyltransferase TrmB [Candidatus Omnitrophica bacterium]|nr:tRNA (guanosine(46)-N7)-methyltransferase TrmB [Candidatus Omnitrophota bacterium]